MTTMNTTTKDRVLQRLEAHKGSFVSGGKLASDLGVTRNSIWKAIRALQAEGYDIESVTGRGYRLSAASTILSAASIQHYVTDHRIVVEYHDSIDSTNTRCKLLAEHGAPEGTFVVANCQTAGRGRQGRPFYSPKGAGIYFSLLLRPTFELEDVSLLTTYAACVTARAIEEIFKVQPQIKWVNDIFCNGHKVCGILTEAQFSAESHAVTYVVVGIGVNVARPEGGYPEQIAHVAQALTSGDEGAEDKRAQLAARVADLFMQDYDRVPDKPFLGYYRAHSLLDGKTVTVYTGTDSFEATVIGVNDDLTLKVRLENGTTKDLAHGEVHIPSSQL